jgi:prepilin-type N-terminal cleavage/methylation domain-containing protein
MKRAGFSLVELIVILAIMGILFTVATLNFNSWLRKSQIEAKTREIYDSLNEARLNSIYQKKPHALVLDTNSVLFKQYSSENEAKFASGTKILRTMNSTYSLTKINGGAFSGEYVMFDSRGYTLPPYLTIYLNPVMSGAMYDCIVVHAARVNMGQGTDANNDGKPDGCTFQ